VKDSIRIINDLSKVANELDRSGHYKYASWLDSIIEKITPSKKSDVAFTSSTAPGSVDNNLRKSYVIHQQKAQRIMYLATKIVSATEPETKRHITKILSSLDASDVSNKSASNVFEQLVEAYKGMYNKLYKEALVNKLLSVESEVIIEEVKSEFKPLFKSHFSEIYFSIKLKCSEIIRDAWFSCLDETNLRFTELVQSAIESWGQDENEEAANTLLQSIDGLKKALGEFHLFEGENDIAV